MKKNEIIQFTKVIIIAFLICAGISFAWVDRPTGAPDNNLAGAINTSDKGQIKGGGGWSGFSQSIYPLLHINGKLMANKLAIMGNGLNGNVATLNGDVILNKYQGGGERKMCVDGDNKIIACYKFTCTFFNGGTISFDSTSFICPNLSVNSLSHYLKSGLQTTMTAQPADGYRFVKWVTGPCSNSTNSVCNFIVNKDDSAIPSFKLIN